MTVREIYEKVKIRMEDALEERVFINYLDDTLNELEIMIEGKYLWLNKGAKKHESKVSGEALWINDLFHPCVIDNILFYATGNKDYKSEFVRKAEAARTRQKELSRGKIRRMPKW